MRKGIIGALIAFCLMGGLPANGQTIGTQNAILCNRAAQYDSNVNGKIELVSPQAGGIYICGFILNGAVSPIKLQLISGVSTGTVNTACGSSNTNITPAFQVSPNVIDSSYAFKGLYVLPNLSLCLSTNATAQAQAIVYFGVRQ